jgi:hypothetical protein
MSEGVPTLRPCQKMVSDRLTTARGGTGADRSVEEAAVIGGRHTGTENRSPEFSELSDPKGL